MTAPNRIKEWRIERGFTQQRLADASGTTMQQIQRLETGQRKLTQDWMVRLSKGLDVFEADLLPLSNRTKADPTAPDTGTVVVDAIPDGGQFIEDPDELALLRFWRRQSREKKLLLVDLLRIGSVSGRRSA